MARRRIEMIDYGDEPMVDHKGRTRPLYKHRGPRPDHARRWRPGPVAKFLLGLFPGARLLATSGTAGIPYAVLGLLALLTSIYLATRFNVTEETLRILRLRPELKAVHLGALVFAVGLYELARFGGALEERSDHSRAARGMASLFLPAAVVAVLAPLMIDAYPRLLEAAWFASLILLVGCIPAALGSLIDLGRLFGTPRAKAVLGVVLALLLGVGLATFIGAEEARRTLASAASKAGFEILPKILG